LKDAKNEGALDSAILIVPEGTGGAKYEMMLQNNPEIHKVEITNIIGEDLIKSALSYPSEKAWEITKIIFPDIGSYVPPATEQSESQG
jgi:hypothetical protein